MKKVLVCALAVFFLMASCSTAFAATFSTSTTYATNADEFTVTTNVIDATSGDMISFLAYNGDTKNTENLVYADQIKLTGSTTTFSYTAKKDQITSTNILLGTTSTAFDPNTASLDDEVRKVNVKLNGVAKATVILPEVADASSTFTVELPLANNLGEPSAKVGTTDLTTVYSDGTLTIHDNAVITNGCEIAITAEVLEEVARDITGIESARFVAKQASENIDEGDEVLTVFAKITYNDGDKYGVRIGKSVETAVDYEAMAIG